MNDYEVDYPDGPDNIIWEDEDEDLCEYCAAYCPCGNPEDAVECPKDNCDCACECHAPAT